MNSEINERKKSNVSIVQGMDISCNKKKRGSVDSSESPGNDQSKSQEAEEEP